MTPYPNSFIRKSAVCFKVYEYTYHFYKGKQLVCLPLAGFVGSTYDPVGIWCQNDIVHRRRKV